MKSASPARLSPDRAEKFSIVYVITADEDDLFPNMALLSMLSVRITNPAVPIFALCDGESAEGLRRKGHRLVDVCDELVSVQTPAGGPMYRNRWVKTQLPLWVRGSFLYLDSDTLVRGSLEDLPRLVSELGAVANHNGRDLDEQISLEDPQILASIALPAEFENYVNGGALFAKSEPRVFEFFTRWHELWQASSSATGRLRDQPSLNAAIVRSGVHLTLLPDTYNVQFRMTNPQQPDALVWHFFSSQRPLETSLSQLLRRCNRTRLRRLQRLVRRAIEAPSPLPRESRLGRIVRHVRSLVRRTLDSMKG